MLSDAADIAGVDDMQRLLRVPGTDLRRWAVGDLLGIGHDSVR